MHPALSVIVFTTASGAGYGLLAWTGILAAAGLLPGGRWLGTGMTALALGLVTAGLLSSTLHLGRPERAWRAFSQWRTSWLSREGVASVVTYIPALLFAASWFWCGSESGFVALMGAFSALCAMATVCATAMIYASLKPVAQWHSAYTVPGYLLYALMSGAMLLNACLVAGASPEVRWSFPALVLTAAGWIWKGLTWRHDDAVSGPATLNSATGLRGGDVRSLEWPHTQENYVLKEMGYRVARKHAARLRKLVHLLAFAGPIVLLAAILAVPRSAATVFALVAVLSQAAGLLCERWLFFAQARHTVALYYGR